MTLMQRLEAQGKYQRTTALLFVGGVAGLAAIWLTGPIGIIEVTRGNALGWVLVILGSVFAVATVACFVAAARRLARPAPGKPSAEFGVVPPSPNPRPSVAWTGTGMDPRAFDMLRDPAPGGSGGSQR
ncbi:hypothetical protein [Leifsonia poae]|uniref:hypothetical protein n=1 Tax=Leifsonia poae TaxID=110933 RepID=UPI003D66D1CE